MREFKPPHKPADATGRLRIFLGGTIEMGQAEDWQKKLASHLATLPFADRIDIYNPRRDNWDNSLPNNYDDPVFKEQVDWELEHQKQADILIYYFADNSVSPITLLELGLFHTRRPVVGAGPDYKRLGNLMVTRDHFPMDIHIGWDEFLRAVDARLAEALEPEKPAAPRPPAP